MQNLKSKDTLLNEEGGLLTETFSDKGNSI